MQLVIAGNYIEYVQYCKIHSPLIVKGFGDASRYVASCDDLRGYWGDIDIVQYGTYAKRKDYPEILEFLNTGWFPRFKAPGLRDYVREAIELHGST